MNALCVHVFVSGKVQGVWYRASTQQTAEQLGLTGWVRNTSDDRVELVACGEQRQIDQLLEWLWDGPARAQVATVETESIPVEAFKSFVVR